MDYLDKIQGQEEGGVLQEYCGALSQLQQPESISYLYHYLSGDLLVVYREIESECECVCVSVRLEMHAHAYIYSQLQKRHMYDQE